MDATCYEVYAIKYGERAGTRRGMLLNVDPHDVPHAMDYFVWAIRNAERTIVVDLGFSRDEGERRGRTFLRCPTKGLGLLGIDAREIDDVIITHMHYDHAGNLDLVPNARFHIQDAEMEFVPGHDPLVLRRYPPPSADLERIVARLDLPPARCTWRRMHVG